MTSSRHARVCLHNKPKTFLYRVLNHACTHTSTHTSNTRTQATSLLPTPMHRAWFPAGAPLLVVVASSLQKTYWSACGPQPRNPLGSFHKPMFAAQLAVGHHLGDGVCKVLRPALIQASHRDAPVHSQVHVVLASEALALRPAQACAGGAGMHACMHTHVLSKHTCSARMQTQAFSKYTCSARMQTQALSKHTCSARMQTHTLSKHTCSARGIHCQVHVVLADEAPT